MEQRITALMNQFVGGVYFPEVTFTDILEVLILTYLIYHVIIWVKNTKAWMLIKGIAVIGSFILVAFILQMNTILFIAKNLLTILATAAVVVFQPELRRALERLGEKNYLSSIIPTGKNKEELRFSNETLEGIVDACYAMSPVKTGALIVIEQATRLNEYVATGIRLDCLVSMQVLINIFEHNTPLHDGAIIVRGNRIVSATCYLPLSDNKNLSKELGTRHRAAVGVSEVSDAFVIVVSEETGAVSIAEGGKITRALKRDELRNRLMEIQKLNSEPKKLPSWWKGKRKNEEKTES